MQSCGREMRQLPGADGPAGKNGDSELTTIVVDSSTENAAVFRQLAQSGSLIDTTGTPRTIVHFLKKHDVSGYIAMILKSGPSE